MRLDAPWKLARSINRPRSILTASLLPGSRDGVYAVVVTHNRLPLLQECIQAIQEQTHQVCGIIVVNNGSSDGTAEWLLGQQKLTVISQPNLGGAGGFNTGIRQARDRGASWIWCMDDDTIPQADCLEKLLVASNFPFARAATSPSPCYVVVSDGRMGPTMDE